MALSHKSINAGWSCFVSHTYTHTQLNKCHIMSYEGGCIKLLDMNRVEPLNHCSKSIEQIFSHTLPIYFFSGMKFLLDWVFISTIKKNETAPPTQLTWQDYLYICDNLQVWRNTWHWLFSIDGMSSHGLVASLCQNILKLGPSTILISLA